jgi:hypothetical protein
VATFNAKKKDARNKTRVSLMQKKHTTKHWSSLMQKKKRCTQQNKSTFNAEKTHNKTEVIFNA